MPFDVTSTSKTKTNQKNPQSNNPKTNEGAREKINEI